ncbi:MAG: glycosyltransferase family 2 protein [Planctomycetota bacterium]|jgi:glycosyltransferase involved in cell wall biosynthesis
MLHGKKIVVIMPAYNAEVTLRKTYDEIPHDIVDEVILTDDASNDRTVEISKSLGIKTFVHRENRGYGANQKTCYEAALKAGADIVVMIHPDYQYPAKLLTAMAGLLATDLFDVVLGSRILGGRALKNDMPLYKYIANRFLTLTENAIIRAKISEYHTGYRAFTRDALLKLPLLENSDDFVFDNQMLAQAVFFDLRIGEVSSPCNYTGESSSINFRRSVIYGFGVLATAMKCFLHRTGIVKFSLFDPNGGKLQV